MQKKEDMKNKPFLTRLSFALAGIKSGFKSERSLRTQGGFAVIAIIALALLQPALIWWALIGVTITLILAAELINTALENLVDHIHPEQHPRIKVVKDCAAGAVLILSFGAVWVGLLALLSVLLD